MPRLVAGLVVAAAATALLLVGSGSGRAQAPGGERTLQLVSRLAGLQFVDQPPRRRERATRGDYVVFTDTLSHPAGARAGALHGVCHVTEPRGSLARALFHCAGTATLGDGALMLEGLARVAGPGEVTFAITGGTGAYEGARGSIRSVPRADGDVSDNTVRLLG